MVASIARRTRERGILREADARLEVLGAGDAARAPQRDGERDRAVHLDVVRRRADARGVGAVRREHGRQGHLRLEEIDSQREDKIDEPVENLGADRIEERLRVRRPMLVGEPARGAGECLGLLERDAPGDPYEEERGCCVAFMRFVFDLMENYVGNRDETGKKVPSLGHRLVCDGRESEGYRVAH